MTRRSNRLLLLALAAAALTFYFGCSQPEDIVTPVTTSVLTLNPSKLPSLPNGMVYELWAARSGDTVSLGRFGYDQTNRVFLNESGQVRPEGGSFRVGGDVLAYDWIFMSVENAGAADTDLKAPANCLLRDRATNPRDNQVALVLPYSDSIFYSTCYFCLSTPSDRDRDTNNMDAGLWFCQYQLEQVNRDVRIGLDSVTYQQKVYPQESIGVVIYTDYTIDPENPLETLQLNYSFDTLEIIQARVTIDSVIISDPPETVMVANPYWQLGERIDTLFDNFTQGTEGFGMVDYSEFGLQYRGWVMAQAVEAQNASVGTFTPPVWYRDNLFNVVRWAEGGGLISTGAFGSVEDFDLGNPHSASTRVPPYPGEDFLVDLPHGAAGPLNLIAKGELRYYPGDVFISLEPWNYKDTTTNFPLILYTGFLPFGAKGELYPDTTSDSPIQYFVMRNLTSPDADIGMPKVIVDIDRF